MNLTPRQIEVLRELANGLRAFKDGRSVSWKLRGRGVTRQIWTLRYYDLVATEHDLEDNATATITAKGRAALTKLEKE